MARRTKRKVCSETESPTRAPAFLGKICLARSWKLLNKKEVDHPQMCSQSNLGNDRKTSILSDRPAYPDDRFEVLEFDDVEKALCCRYV